MRNIILPALIAVSLCGCIFGDGKAKHQLGLYDCTESLCSQPGRFCYQMGAISELHGN